MTNSPEIFKFTQLPNYPFTQFLNSQIANQKSNSAFAVHALVPLKRLSDAEEEIEMFQRVTALFHGYRKDRRIEVIPHVKTNRPDRRPVPDSAAHRMRHIVEITTGRYRVRAGITVRLHPAQQAVRHITSRGENVSHIVKHYGAHVIAHERQRQWRRAQFKIVQEDSFSS